MKVLIITATFHEIEPFIKKFPKADILVTGVGAPAVLFSLMNYLNKHKYDLLVQAGIAGSFDCHLDLGSVFAVRRDRFADLGIVQQGVFTSIYNTPLADGDGFPYSNGWLENQADLWQQTECETVDAITINTISSVVNSYDLSTSRLIESMEGAALHLVGLSLKIPFIQLRAISNYVGERDKSKWKISAAVEQLNQKLIQTFNKLADE